MQYSKEEIEQYVKNKASRIAFGYEHAKRVYKLAKKLGSKYDKEILHAVAFLHDIELTGEHETKSAKHAGILLKHRMSKPDIFRVQEAIKDHTTIGKPKSVEGILVHDAALLDCLGGVGLLQLAMISGKKDLKEVVKYINNYRTMIASKLILKQSRSLAAERMEMMDLVLDALDREL